MRVAILTRDYPPTIGGVATHVEGLVRALKEMGVEVDLYVGHDDVRTLLLPFDMPLKRYDVVHVQSAPYGAFVYGVPLVVTVHSPVLEEFDHYRSAVKLVSLPAAALEKGSLARASAVLAVSSQSRADLVRRYRLDPDKVDVIGNGVDYGRFAREERAGRDAKSILVVSRLEPRKNVAEAIEAVAMLPPGSCTIKIAGDGSERRLLEDLAKRLGAQDRVRFLGRVDASRLPELYAGSAIFLTTSHSEGFGLSLLEALSSGCACVASDLPTHRALVQSGRSGIIYKTKADLAAALKGLLSSPDDVAKLGEAAQHAARDQTWANVARRVVDAYQRACGEGSVHRAQAGASL